MDTIALLPLAARVGSYVHNEHKAGRTPIFDLNGITLSPPIPRGLAGAPCGGIGGGAIGRGVRGEFRRYSIVPGRYRHVVSPSSVFACRVAGRGIEDASTTLSVEKPASSSPLAGWKWGSDPSVKLGERSTYHALYPRSWTEFKDPTNKNTGVSITERQVSPFLPDNYTDSALPCAVFAFDVVNESEEDREVSVRAAARGREGRGT